MTRHLVVVLALVAIGCGKKRASHDDAGVVKRDGGGHDAVLGPGAIAAALDAKCGAGDLEACRSLGIMYTGGGGVTEDRRRAAALFDRACTGKNLAACNQLALALAEGLGVDKDPAKATEMFQQTCDAGYMLACRNFGLLLRDGRGVPVDLSRAAALLDRACKGGAPYACTNAGDLDVMLAGSGDAELHHKQMLAHYKQGCDDGDPTSCRQIGIAYLEGTAIRASTAAAAVWLDRGCRADDPIACRVLGAMRVQGIGVNQDRALGRELLVRACDRKDGEACRAIKELDSPGDAGVSDAAGSPSSKPAKNAH